jgi:Tfp pilus assembly protein PilV
MRDQDGYSLIEAMISLIIGSVLLFSFYDLYNATYRMAQDSLERAYAYNMAFRNLDEEKWHTAYRVAGLEQDSDEFGTDGPFKYQPEARGSYHLHGTVTALPNTSITVQSVSVDWGYETTNRPTITVETYVRFPGGHYY